MKRDFELEKVISKGAFGTVYKGKYKNEQVAIKKIKVQKDDPSFKYLKSEVEILKQMDHPNIVKLIRYLPYQDCIFLITELVEGQDLKNYLNVQNYLDRRIAKKIFRELLGALIYLRDNKIIHRDIKPANIVFTSTNISEASIKLIDFGLSTIIEKSLAETNVGSPLYSAPEVAQFFGCTHKADTWSLGVVFYEALYGILPFWACSIDELLQLQKGDIKYPKHANADWTAQELISSMLKINPDERVDYEELLTLRFFQEETKYEETKFGEVTWTYFDGLETGPKKEEYRKYLASINNIGEEKPTPEEFSPIIYDYTLNREFVLKIKDGENIITSTKRDEFDQNKIEVLKSIDEIKLMKLNSCVYELDRLEKKTLCSCVYKYFCKVSQDTIDIIKDMIINEGLTNLMIDELDCMKTQIELYYSMAIEDFLEKYGVDDERNSTETFVKLSKTIKEFKEFKKQSTNDEEFEVVRECVNLEYPREKSFKTPKNDKKSDFKF